MGYFSPVASIGRESVERDDVNRLLFDQQFVPSSKGLGFTPSFGILYDPAGYNAPKTVAPAPAPAPAPNINVVAYTPPPTTPYYIIPTTGITAPASAPAPLPVYGPGTSNPAPTESVVAPDNTQAKTDVVTQQGKTGIVNFLSGLLPSAKNPLLDAPKDSSIVDTVDHPDPTKALAAAKSSSPYIAVGIAALAFLLMRKK